MHHTQTKTLGWNHNGDFSGDVNVAVSAEAVSGPWPDDDKPYTVLIPFEDIKELVAEYVRRQIIEQAENATADELLGLE